MNFMCCLGNSYLVLEWYLPDEASFHFSQPISPCFKVSQVCVARYLPATHSYLTSSQIESREIGADSGDTFLVMEGQREGRKMWTQSAMCWLYWLGACAKKSLSIPSFLVFTLNPTALLYTGITAECPLYPSLLQSSISNVSHEPQALLWMPSSTIKKMTA